MLLKHWLSSVRSKQIIAAATRFKEAWAAALKEADAGGPISGEHDFLEMHDAALGLMAATNTQTLEAALDALNDFES
jgi:hypothetical protein